MGFLFPCEDEEMFHLELNALKSKYPDATHHCYAYRINPNALAEFSSDDGEPSGTAGLPILNQLKSYDVVNVAIVVVRYFGGTKLGKPGLIESYGQAAEECLQQARLSSIIRVQLFDVVYAYPQENLINKLVLNHNLMEQQSEYLAQVRKTFACPIENSAKFEAELESLAHLSITFTKNEESFIAG